MRSLRAVNLRDIQSQRGLPEALPEDEHILWQGSPEVRLMTRNVFHTSKLAIYFGLLLAMRGYFAYADTANISSTIVATLWTTPAFFGAWLCWYWVARLAATTAVYTITNKRVVMRVGIVLSITFNLPYKQIVSASVRRYAGSAGDIAIDVAPPNRLPYFGFWPHTRLLSFASARPLLRCIADVSPAAQALTSAWSADRGAEATTAKIQPSNRTHQGFVLGHISATDTALSRSA